MHSPSLSPRTALYCCPTGLLNRIDTPRVASPVVRSAPESLRTVVAARRPPPVERTRTSSAMSAINRLTQQGQEAVLLVLAKSRILQAPCARRGQTQRLIELPIRQQPGVGGDLASQELQLQSTVEINPQVPVLAVTHWVSLSEWHNLMKAPCFPGVWRKLRASAG